ncbi:MAG: cytochrome c oxidase subunit I [Deltaproteobacteria bacterium]|nr:MAG: cytochrome c oxidase subunit I [Deltaproteobacteria bacterium]
MSHGEPTSFWRKYIFSVDHKVIGKQYMLTGLFMALVGGFLAFGLRHHLAWPDQDVPLLGALAPHQYNSVVTMHGSIMIFWVAMPLLVAGFGNYVLPIMVGADDMAFPRLNMMSYWTFFVSVVIVIASFFVPGGAAAGGWTSYPPLSDAAEMSGVNWGVNLWLLAVAVEFASFLMGGINIITTALNLRVKGLTLMRLPMFVWQQIIASIVFLLSVGPLVAGAAMLLLDRTIGSGFFAPAQGGDPLLFQHLFWFFGHPEVYVLLLPTIGIVSEVITCNARKAIYGYKMILYSTIAAGVLSFVVWAHHQFISGIDPRLATPFSLTTILISVPFAVAMFAFLATLVRGSIRFPASMLFALGFIANFFVGGVTGVILGSAAADIYFHDTYFVVAHFHYTLVPSVFFGTFAGIYHWFPKMWGRRLNETLGKLHFLGTFVFFNMVFLPQFKLGVMGHHRRIADPSLVYDFLKGGQDLQVLSTVGVIGLLLTQVLFIFNFFYSMKAGKKADRNPWQATTLEWAAPSPPPHGNFDEVPQVYRGAYEYSLPGDGPDFVPQWQADSGGRTAGGDGGSADAAGDGRATEGSASTDREEA